MILDATTLLSSNQAVTASAASTSVYDAAGTGVGNPAGEIFGVQSTVFGRDIGGGGPAISAPQFVAIVGTAFTASGSATLQFQLQAAIDDGTGNPSTWDTIAETDTLGKALLVSGAKVSLTIPDRYLGQGMPRFYRLYYNVGTGPMTAGTIAFAGLVTGVDDALSQIYPSGF